MAWSFVGISSVVESTGTTITLTEPASCASGDLMVACIAARMASSSAISMPSNWLGYVGQFNNNIQTNTSATASGQLSYATRGSSALPMTWTFPTTVSVAIGRIVAYRGGNSSFTDPTDLNAFTQVTTATNTTAVNVAGFTTNEADTLIVAMIAGGQEAAWSAFKSANAPTTASGVTDTSTAPSTTTWIERADTNTVTNTDTSLAIFDAVKTAAGATGNFTATSSLGAAHVVAACAFKIFTAPTPSLLFNPAAPMIPFFIMR